MKQTYSEKLLDPRWQKKRLEIMQRDKWRCVTCRNDKKTLHVHHKKYVSGRSPWDYEESELITLCYICHEGEHYPDIKKLTYNPILISAKELLTLDYGKSNKYVDGWNKEFFIPAIVQWQYGHYLKIKDMSSAAYKNDPIIAGRVSKKDYEIFLEEKINETCLKYGVQITKERKVIYGA